MKAIWFVIPLLSLASCVAERTSAYDVGRRESARLRDSHMRWIDESPRKIEIMDVPANALSQEARDAGFLAATVDAHLVLLYTAENEGLLFGRPSSAESDGLKCLGLTLETTEGKDIFRFRVNAKKGPNQAPEDTARKLADPQR